MDSMKMTCFAKLVVPMQAPEVRSLAQPMDVLSSLGILRVESRADSKHASTNEKEVGSTGGL